MQGYTRLETYRYERKFVGEKVPRSVAETFVRQNSAFFTRTFPSRQVNNVYFDTPGMDCFMDNLFGVGNRWKVRVRWYGELFGAISAPVLEFKIKKGFTGTKKSYELPPFQIPEEGFDGSIWRPLFLKADLPGDVRERLAGLHPVLLNAYQRSYFESANKKFRVTVDDKMEYYNLRSTWNYFLHVHREQLKSVIELKYDQNWQNEADVITNQLPFRLDKNSKYVVGISHFKSEIAQ